MSKRPHEEEVIRYDENGDPLKTPIYPDEVTEQWMTGSNNGITTPSPTPTTPTTPVTTPSGTTPSGTTPTTTVPMNYDVFLNQQRESAYKSAEAERARAEKAAETARQKQIIDAQNAYKTGLSTYGANAEAAASMGLTGSGYGEYLTGKAYATQRGEVASANRTAAALKEQALYNEQSAKNTADAIYAEGMINYGEKQKVEGENAYANLSTMAANGATLEQITNSADWGRLSPEQQTVISRTVSEKTLVSRLNAGESFETLMLTEDWSALDDAGRTRLQNYATGLGESAYANVLDMINGGAAISDIENLFVWTNLSEPDKNRIRGREAYLQAKAAIENGLYDAESITTLPGYEYMSEPDKASLNNQIAQRDENTINGAIENILYGDNVVISSLGLGAEEEKALRTRLDGEINTMIKIDPSTAEQVIEINYANGNIGRDAYYTYNSTLLDGAYKLSDITADNCGEVIDLIDDFLHAGKISEEEAGVRKREAVSSFAKSERPNVTRDGDRLKFKGGEYKIKSTASERTSKILDASVGTSKIPEYAIAYYDDNLYAYVDGEWHKINHKDGDDYTEDIKKGDEKTQYRDAGTLEGGYGPAVTSGPLFRK